MAKSEQLKNYVSDDGTYLIPVGWSVFSTIRVSGVANLQEAIEVAEREIDNIPVDSNAEYVDGSYILNIGSDEEIIAAQDYVNLSSIVINKNGEIHT